MYDTAIADLKDLSSFLAFCACQWKIKAPPGEITSLKDFRLEERSFVCIENMINKYIKDAVHSPKAFKNKKEISLTIFV